MGDRRILISVQSVSRIYRMGEVDVRALQNASMDIYEGEVVIIVGPSGSGKSTLLNMIGGMDRPTSGKILFSGHDISAASESELTAFRRDKVGFVFQFFNLIPTLTALENVQVATELRGNTTDPIESLRLVGLESRANHFPSQMSGGEQQRVSIARALAGDPELLLCDEPTGSLDIETSRQVLGMLKKLNAEQGKTIALITHNGAIAGIGDRVAHMHDGYIYSVTANEQVMPVEQIEW